VMGTPGRSAWARNTDISEMAETATT